MTREHGTHMSNFVGRLRCFSSAPDGDAKTGELYFNTSDNRIYQYDGGNWLATGQMATSTSTSSSTSSTSTSTSVTE